MSQGKIRAALDDELYQLDTAFHTAIPNVHFDPVKNTPYQKTKITPQTVENPTYGDNFHRERGSFLVVLCYPLGSGEGAVMDKADEVKGWFYRGKSIEQSGVTVTIRTTPTIGTAYVSDDRYCVPVTIFYYANMC